VTDGKFTWFFSAYIVDRPARHRFPDKDIEGHVVLETVLRWLDLVRQGRRGDLDREIRDLVS